jgi:GTP cyclohydrolase I
VHDPPRQDAGHLVASAAADEIVLLRDVQFVSHCEHHTPIVGRAHIGYLPTMRVVGVSKLVRLVQMCTPGDFKFRNV